eukprot:jgi/Botrbrau1/20736/Bobra.0058s0064.1
MSIACALSCSMLTSTCLYKDLSGQSIARYASHKAYAYTTIIHNALCSRDIDLESSECSHYSEYRSLTIVNTAFLARSLLCAIWTVQTDSRPERTCMCGSVSGKLMLESSYPIWIATT